MTPSTTRVRLYETVRTAHLERAKALAPATIIYRQRRYDFHDDAAIGMDLLQASRAGAAVLLFRSRATAIEINEPLMLSALPATALALAALAARAALLGRRARVVTYAIANADPFAAPVHGVRPKLRRVVDLLLARAVAKRVDRIAFGTPAAAAIYRTRLPQPQRSTYALIPALPAPRALQGRKRPESVVFLGAFAERKGIDLLLQAWPTVVAARPGASLTVLGKGRLEPMVRSAAERLPGMSVRIDPPRDEILRVLDRTEVLVLPSQPAPRWREQVGLPVVEGLASGCRIVTTTETGLASWLAEHGHSVIDRAGDVDALAASLLEQLASIRSPADVQDDLPSRDGRLAADDWLFDGSGPVR